MSHAPRHFAAELDAIKAQRLVMGRVAEQRLDAAVSALVARDRQMLAEIVAGDSRINELQIDIDLRCFTLFALHQPVAIDLRSAVSAVRINADLERVGDLAVNIGEAAQRYLQHPPVKPLIDLPRMGQLALKMLREALDAFVSRRRHAGPARAEPDDWLDALKDQIFRELLTFMPGNPRTIEPSVDLVLISRHLERVGDHATNIAEDVIFIVEARDIRHRPIVRSAARAPPLRARPASNAGSTQAHHRCSRRPRRHVRNRLVFPNVLAFNRSWRCRVEMSGGAQQSHAAE